ncbi:uncharacterized protein V1516DRAFT_638232 [Lipomyces oligophaga]|uniref:uncharacterized protein n=1 Tax=Lipomyces oligophaga TaxID=45792 RepID=UPI0034CDBD71
MAPRDVRNIDYYVVDPEPMPSSIPSVPEVGATSSPLISASYYIGDRCRAYNDDFMLCRSQSRVGPVDCLKEGRRVTRCAISVLEDINKHCAGEFESHWSCLDFHQNKMERCRVPEMYLSKCVKKFLNLEKVIPDAEGIPVHERHMPGKV